MKFSEDKIAEVVRVNLGHIGTSRILIGGALTELYKMVRKPRTTTHRLFCEKYSIKLPYSTAVNYIALYEDSINPVTKPEKKTVTKPASKPVTKPASKPVTTKPASKPVTKPASKPVTKPEEIILTKSEAMAFVRIDILKTKTEEKSMAAAAESSKELARVEELGAGYMALIGDQTKVELAYLYHWRKTVMADLAKGKVSIDYLSEDVQTMLNNAIRPEDINDDVNSAEVVRECHKYVHGLPGAMDAQGLAFYLYL